MYNPIHIPGITASTEEQNVFRLTAMENDLRFTNKLLCSCKFPSDAPNLFERLELFRNRGEELMADLKKLQQGESHDLKLFERNFWIWKSEIWEYLADKI